MKFHNLSRHSQFSGAHHHNQQRGVSPMKHQQLQQLQQQAANQIQRQPQHQHQIQSDDEDDDFDEPRHYFDNLSGEHNPQIHQHQHHKSQTISNSNQTSSDTNSFLMDKNKKLFPQKLWELIHNPSIQHCLRWSQDGQRVYLNRNEFEAYYLKTPNNQFHTQKAISFVRQMNMYGFRKVDDCYYENDNFRRDQQHLLRNMIRRHPNKGLFVGLDHHQLAAAAAAQQAMQVNQQLQHFENQHKHRAEQALRLNGYLNTHQFHPSILSHTAQQLKHHNHSAQFEHMSSQLAQVAANHLSQQHQNLLQGNINLSKHSNNIVTNNNNIDGGHPVDKINHLNHLNIQPSHQPKKSRLLSNFYASASNVNQLGADVTNPATQLIHNQDSMHSTSSVDTQPSQCSSLLNSESAGSPQPDSPTSLHQRMSSLPNHRRQASSSSASIRAAVLAASKEGVLQNQMNSSKFALDPNQQQGATDLSGQSLAARQALHQTLVRSLLQLKQQQSQDFLASLQQQQNSRSLLESLASLSSAGTGSIVDPTSNSPTERTATPPSESPSPALNGETKYDEERNYAENNNIALDLAKSSTSLKRSAELMAKSDYDDLDVDEGIGARNLEREDDGRVLSPSESPVDAAKKVRRFLDNQMSQDGDDAVASMKQEQAASPASRSDGLPSKKRFKLENGCDDGESLTKSLIIEVCHRRGNQLNEMALDEAARYTECFLDILLDDAALIAQHSTTNADSKKSDEHDEDASKSPGEESEIKQGTGVIDISSLSLALKLIPSKLLTAIQQQVDSRTQP